jgi:hypothetical protein
VWPDTNLISASLEEEGSDSSEDRDSGESNVGGRVGGGGWGLNISPDSRYHDDQLTALGIPPLASPALALEAPDPDPTPVPVVELLVMVVGVDMVIMVMVELELEPVDEEAEPAIPLEEMLN